MIKVFALMFIVVCLISLIWATAIQNCDKKDYDDTEYP
jgi:hypothetical protein